MGLSDLSAIERKHSGSTLEMYICQVCGRDFLATSPRVLVCPDCIDLQKTELSRSEKKTEPSGLSRIAPSPFAGNSLQHVSDQSQSIVLNPPENGESGQVGLPRLPSLLFPSYADKRSEKEIASLGSTASYLTPPNEVSPKDLVLSAFRLLTPMHKLYLRDFKSETPVLNHGKTGWPHRSAFCHHSAIPGMVGVELRKSTDGNDNVALGGVQHCGDIWKCPVCGLYSALRWQGDVIAVEEALRTEGYRLLLCVLTISHDNDTTLDTEIDILRKAYTKLFQQRTKGQKKRAKRLGIVGRMRAWDILYGVNGWHAHMNVVIAISPDTPQENINQIFHELDCLYRVAVHDAGGFASMDHGLKIEEYRNGKSYMVRTGLEGLRTISRGEKFALGYELVSTDTKIQHGLSIGALRLASVEGYQGYGLHLSKEKAARLCLEYAATMAGERSVISAGVIRERLRTIGKCEEASDQENTSALPDVEYTILGVIPSADYHREIVGHDRFVPLLQAMRSGPIELSQFLAGIGIVLEPRNVSLQFNAIDCIPWKRENDRERGIEIVRKGAIIRSSGNHTHTEIDIDSHDLDEYL